MEGLERVEFEPKIWGPHLWLVLGCIARFYPMSPTQTERCKHGEFISSLPYILPCAGCRHNLHQSFQIDWDQHKDEYLHDRTSFSKFINSLHNQVNDKANKRQYTLHQHVEKFESFRRNCVCQAMDPSIWGPSCWLFLDIIGRNYPTTPNTQVLTQHMILISSLPHILPCNTSRSTAARVLAILEWEEHKQSIVAQRSTFSRFINMFHNIVNFKLDKTDIHHDSTNLER